MSYISLINKLGFDIDPFAKTNADEEDRIDKYFIEPPFYKAVYGDLDSPKSAIVFAPRGGGKTALKRKIEISSEHDPFLCISYNNFNIVGYQLENINLVYHLKNIVKLILVAVMTRFGEIGINNLTKQDRHLLYLFIKEYFSEINKTELKEAINSVKNFGDKAKEWWNTFTGPIGIVINNLLSKIGFEKIEIEKFGIEGGNLGSLTDQLETLQVISKKLGYKCIYILIDKIDENYLTGSKASNSYKFIESLLTNMQLLELSGFGFKFFLWDNIREDYQKDARPDRIKYYTLSWHKQQLREMLSKRLKAYSENKVASFTQICDVEKVNDIDDLITLFGQGSPRNIIRICKEIVDQQSEISTNVNKISLNSIIAGFEVFAENYSNEVLIDKVINELKKIKRVAFTAKYIYTNVFKISQQAGSSKIKVWLDTGVIEQLGSIQQNKRMVNLYGIKNLIIAKHIFSELGVFEFVNKKLYTCPECSHLLLRDWDIEPEHLCDNCQKIVRKQ